MPRTRLHRTYRMRSPARGYCILPRPFTAGAENCSLAQERADVEINLSHEQGFVRWLAGGMIRRGWILAMRGETNEGIAELEQGLVIWRARAGNSGLTTSWPSRPRRSGREGASRMRSASWPKPWGSWKRMRSATTRQNYTGSGRAVARGQHSAGPIHRRSGTLLSPGPRRRPPSACEVV